MIHVFIPSYHRPSNCKTAKFLVRKGYDAKYIHVFLDSEADDIKDYEEHMDKIGVNIHVFDMDEARRRYDYVHRASPSLRSAGQARNMFADFAKSMGIDFYVVIDDDTEHYEIRILGNYICTARIDDIIRYFTWAENFMRKHKIGLFGLSQTGDFYSSKYVDINIMRAKVMNTTFVLLPYVYRGERGVQDNDTSMFVSVLNEGYFTGSLRSGLVLKQTLSATAKGGLTDLYNECKLYNKSMVTPIQYPSAIRAEKQIKNGGRLHHRINYRYLSPKIMKGSRGNIAWDTYPEDVPFTNEPKRGYDIRPKQA